MIGMALVAVLMCVNFTACGGSDDDPTEGSTTDLAKAIIGIWVQDGDNDIMVIKTDKTLTCYEDETDYKNNEISEVMKWEFNGKEWIYFYYEDGDLCLELRPQEVKKDIIIWKDYSGEGYSDSYGNYRLWTWERYSK